MPHELIQTEKEEIPSAESELGVTSDRESRKARVRVRTWSKFRHRKREPRILSINQNLRHTRGECRIRVF